MLVQAVHQTQFFFSKKRRNDIYRFIFRMDGSYILYSQHATFAIQNIEPAVILYYKLNSPIAFSHVLCASKTADCQNFINFFPAAGLSMQLRLDNGNSVIIFIYDVYEIVSKSYIGW